MVVVIACVVVLVVVMGGRGGGACGDGYAHGEGAVGPRPQLALPGRWSCLISCLMPLPPPSQHRRATDGRPVAIKRLLRQFYGLARKEISALIVSDEHPNVVRHAGRGRAWTRLQLCHGRLHDGTAASRASLHRLVMNLRRYLQVLCHGGGRRVRLPGARALSLHAGRRHGCCHHAGPVCGPRRRAHALCLPRGPGRGCRAGSAARAGHSAQASRELFF